MELFPDGENAATDATPDAAPAGEPSILDYPQTIADLETAEVLAEAADLVRTDDEVIHSGDPVIVEEPEEEEP